jgi:hypothetical protein
MSLGDVALPPLSEEQHLHTAPHSSGLSAAKAISKKHEIFGKARISAKSWLLRPSATLLCSEPEF